MDGITESKVEYCPYAAREQLPQREANPLSTWDVLNSGDLDRVSHRKKVVTFIMNLIKNLSAKSLVSDSLVSEVKSTHGRTDVTMIVSEFTGQINRRFVLKLSPRDNAYNAKINGKILQMLGLVVPNFFISRANEPVFSALWKYAEANGRNQGTIKDQKKAKLVFMEAFRGSDLQQFIITKSIFKLSKIQWANTLEYFGKLAVFDLSIGNHDRFFRVQLGKSLEETDPFCNAGNVVVYYPPTAQGENFPEIYTIDNGSFLTVLSEASARAKGTVQSDEPSYSQESLALFNRLKSSESDRLIFADKIYQGIYQAMLDAKFVCKPNQGQVFPSGKFALTPLIKGIELGFQALEQFAQNETARSELIALTDSMDLSEPEKKLMVKMNELFYAFLGTKYTREGENENTTI